LKDQIDDERLYVIHNLVEVTYEPLLEHRQDELVRIYDSDADEIMPLAMPNGAVFFQTKFYNHIFLVNDDCEFGKAHNQLMIDALRDALNASDTPKKIDFFFDFQVNAKRLLGEFIEGWENYDLIRRTDEEQGDRFVVVNKETNEPPEHLLPLRKFLFLEGGSIISQNQNIRNLEVY